MSFAKSSLLIISLLVSACTFQPLYSEENVEDLSHIKVATIPEREGQLLRNELIDLFVFNANNPKKTYLLIVEPAYSTKDIGVRRDATTSRKESIVSAVIKLKDLTTKHIVYTSTLSAQNSYVVGSTNFFANVITEQEADKQTFRNLAKLIQLDVATYFAKAHADCQ